MGLGQSTPQKIYIQNTILNAEEVSSALWLSWLISAAFFAFGVVHSVGCIFFTDSALKLWPIYLSAVIILGLFTVAIIVTTLVYMFNKSSFGTWRYNRTIYSSSLFTVIAVVLYMAFGGAWLSNNHSHYDSVPVVDLASAPELTRSFIGLYFVLSLLCYFGAYINFDASLNYMYPEQVYKLKGASSLVESKMTNSSSGFPRRSSRIQ
jgi:hypothetical protein